MRVPSPTTQREVERGRYGEMKGRVFNNSPNPMVYRSRIDEREVAEGDIGGGSGRASEEEEEAERSSSGAERKTNTSVSQKGKEWMGKASQRK